MSCKITVDEVREETAYWKKFWNGKETASAEDYRNYGRYLYKVKDYREAVSFFQKAGADPDALFMLGVCYSTGKGTDCDVRRGKQYLSEAGLLFEGMSDDGETDFKKSICLFYGKEDFLTALKYLRSAVNKKNGRALYLMGYLKFRGACGANKYRKEAAAYLKEAAQLGVSNAKYMLYYNQPAEFDAPALRDLQEINSFQLGQYMRVLERNDDAHSYYHIGLHYARGFPMDQEYNRTVYFQKAKKSFEEAFKLGRRDAERQLLLLNSQGHS